MMSNRPVATEFREGDEVVLAEGTYQGTPGVFVRLTKDANWADIKERDGRVRSHPVAWLDHSTGATSGPAN
jgi:transcription antitermination factor NusG